MVKAIDSERRKTELLGMQRGQGECGQMIEDNDSSLIRELFNLH